ncbi:BCL2/adenovirus E1B 19 kDa protein-interacting protein 2 isoform X2 [Archocentrus centrarchus]|uniref:BCL2/adenovirus E1B 19 kDa protein-interacting protein 2 isoform X2 n=1 Tax=Archocentrus centrarchus TaxID=63155 RepID=UPI0011EA06D0|nr:bcl-2/adenovirus E1B 19 kDa-interacting protein 2-like protein isoform X2 [Archocentrus centrarchus]
MSSGEPLGVHTDSQVISAVCLQPVSPVLLHLNVVFLRKQSLSSRNNMESREEEPEEDTQRSFLEDEDPENIQPPNSTTTTSTTTADSPSALGPNLAAATDAQSDDEETGEKPLIAVASTKRTEDEEEVEEECGGKISAGSEEGEEDEGCKEDELHKVSDVKPGGADSEDKSLTPTRDRPAPPSTLALSSPQPVKKKVLMAPTLSLSLGRSESTVSDDLPSVFLSPSPEDEDDTALDFDLDAMETPSDNESLAFPMYDLNVEDDLRRLGVASSRHRGHSSSPRPRSDSKTGSLLETDQSGLGFLEREDVVDSQGIKWRCFATGDPPQESRANMSVLEPFLRVLSHGGYYGDGMNDIIVFSSCYLPENSLENYQYVMDNLFRFVVGTLELMVAENYVIVYLCAGGQKEKLPGISWLRECYTTIDRRLRKNLKGFYVVHPTWYIKALITIIKPFISTKFSRKLQFINSLKELSNVIPTEHVQIPDCVRQYDEKRSR